MKRRDFFLISVASCALALAVGCTPTLEPCDPCKGSGAAACGAPDCVLGRVACNGPCLRKDSPGWKVKEVPGHRPDLLWMPFKNADGSMQWVSQNHLGEVVEFVDGNWILAGKCKTCDGTLRMVCPACQGKKPCPRCNGQGKVKV